MKRRELIALMGASVAWPFAALAQEPGRTYRIGCLTSSARNSPPNAAMFDELRRLGFIEGQNLTIEWRVYALHYDLIPEFAAELVKAKVDVIYATGDAVRVAQRATATIPVLGIAQDMVGQGLVNSLARPGGNTTGVSVLATTGDLNRSRAWASSHGDPRQFQGDQIIGTSGIAGSGARTRRRGFDASSR